MRGKGSIYLSLGLTLLLGARAQAQGIPPEDPKDAKSGAGTSATPAAGDAAPSPDEIIEQMTGNGSGATEENKVDAETNPALLEDGNFEAGRDIFENIFKQNTTDGAVVEGLPGMRIEEVNLQGIMSGAFGTVALFVGKDKQIYTARLNQKLYNGRLSDIQKDKVTFEQEVVDEFGKRRPPIVKEVFLYTQKQKGRGQ